MNCVKKGYLLLFFLSSITALSLPGFAQNLYTRDFVLKPENKFEHLTMADGLSSSIVNSIVQDQKGFMWFGTENGLNRYDGYNFTVFKHNVQDTNSLSDNTIRAIAKDKKGNLWIGTLNGLNLFDPVREKTTRYFHQPGVSSSLSNNSINRNALWLDRKGMLWIGTQKGLSRFNPQTNTFTSFLHQPNQTGSLISNNITAIFEDRNGTLWIGTDKGLNSLIPDQKGFHTPLNDSTLQLKIPRPFILSINEDNLGFLWIGTYDGIFRRDPATGEFKKYEEIENWAQREDAFKKQKEIDIWANIIFKDSKGHLWIGSHYTGLYAVDPISNKIEHYEYDPDNQNGLGSARIHSIAEIQSGILYIGNIDNGIDILNFTKEQFTVYLPDLDIPGFIRNTEVLAISEDKIGNIWMGTSGNGLFSLNLKTGKGTMYKNVYNNDLEHVLSLNNNYPSEIQQDKWGNFWIGTYMGGLQYFNLQTKKFINYLPEVDNPKSISDVGVLTFLQGEDGSLWVGTLAGGLNYFDPLTKQFTRYIHNPNDPNSIGPGQINSITKDENGYLWIATQGGLNRMDLKTKHFTAYKHNPVDPLSISSDITTYIYRDKRNILWVGTRSAGLNRMDAKTGTFKRYTTNDGLPDNFVVGIIEDRRGNLWISTRNGLCSFNPQREVFHTYDMQDGLNTNDFKLECLFKAMDGKMYFGGINGFTIFHPDSIQSNTYVPPVHITGFKIFDKKVTLDEKEVPLSYQQNFFSFDFVALNYLNSGKNQYAYRLEGFDKDWIQSGTRRYASYTNLDPGTYYFKVKGSNNNGIWNEQGASLKVIIYPPPWRTWWAYAFYFLCLIAGILAFDRYQRKRLIEKEREKAREKELQQARELEKAYKELELKSTELTQQKEELQTTLEDLQDTQTQLIQKEKMASLGELTAGIAHEIQNPLNFVNNFSEVNKELMEELKEGPFLHLPQKEKQEAAAILDDLIQNLDKIHHHGQRADSIVKNMLQHSRASSGEKQLTDINALADEYLRLAYHGLRAKDKDFNAEFKLEADPAVGKIAMVPQEIGRVLLNLFNNAFYATSQKKAQLNGQYQPQVIVRTNRVGDKLEIRVKDNGTGIPESVKQKIFQPFFTTKPTGEGTGLGLSLSYDIITKGHGGELKVESKEGEFSEFVIHLPLMINFP